MIELLLQAERALGMGALDQAERLYWQAIDADSQNAIAIVGLAKVARTRGDDRTAIAFVRRALKVDAENAVARRLVAELEAAQPTDAAQAAPAPKPAADVPRAATATRAAEAPEPSVTREPAATGEAPAATPAAAVPGTAPAAEPDPGAKRGGRPDLEWPAADLEQVRPPRDP
ncbi:MAG TPA: tetratricopeptide repeat protein [Candidatus Limnocylindrales bacterium]